MLFSQLNYELLGAESTLYAVFFILYITSYSTLHINKTITYTLIPGYEKYTG